MKLLKRSGAATCTEGEVGPQQRECMYSALHIEIVDMHNVEEVTDYLRVFSSQKMHVLIK